MAHEFKATRQVEFSETDMAGIVHYSNFFKYMETAEHAFYRSLGFSVLFREHSPPIGFPRVHASCDYKKPLRFEDVVEIQLLVREIRSKAIGYRFRFRNLSAPARHEVATGALTIVCVSYAPDGSMSATHLPDWIREKIEVAPSELL